MSNKPIRDESAEPIARVASDPLVWLAAAFATGIVLSAQTEAGYVGWAALLAACLLGVFLMAARSVGTVLLIAVFIAAGGASYSLEQTSVGPERLRRIYDEGRVESSEPVRMKGTVSGSPEPAYGGQFVMVAADSIEHKGRSMTVAGLVRVFVVTPSPEAERDLAEFHLRSGSPVMINCRLEREDRYLNPGVVPRRQLLDQQGIDATCSLKSPLLIQRAGPDGFPDPLGFARDIRSRLIEEMRTRFSSETAGVLAAATLGDKYFLDRRTATLFREGGTFHLLVISGLHITFLGGLVLLVMRSATGNRWLQFAVTIPFLWAYSIAVGAEAPVIRACLMFTAVLLGYVLMRNASPLNTLGLCALLLLAWRPSDLFTPSFQLTFASVVGIIGFGFPLVGSLRAIGSWMPTAKRPFPPNAGRWLRRSCEAIYWNNAAWEIKVGRQTWSARLFKEPLFRGRLPDTLRRWTSYAIEGMIVSFAVQLWLLPLMVFYFHRVTFAGVVLNLWVGTLLAMQSLAAFAAIVLGNIAELPAVPFVEITELLNRIMTAVPGLMVDLGWASTRVPIYSGAGSALYLVYFVPLIFLAAAATRWERGLFARPSEMPTGDTLKVWGSAAAAVAIGAVILFHPFSSPGADGELTVEFLDAGQGDAVFVTFPDGRTMLVDAGGRPNYNRSANDEDEEIFEPDIMRIGEGVVSEFLWERGYSRVDILAASHAHADHEQGLVDVAGNFRVSGVYLSTLHGESDDTIELLGRARRQGAELIILEAGQEVEIGGVLVEVLYPPAGLDREQLATNDRSLVLRLTYGDRTFLLTGDIEEAGERWLVEQGVLRMTDVVKVPHHGSRTSSSAEFVAAVAADHAVIPVGRRSPYGHPHPEVVERWLNAGARLRTTGEKGAIRFTTDGYFLTVQQFVP